MQRLVSLRCAKVRRTSVCLLATQRGPRYRSGDGVTVAMDCNQLDDRGLPQMSRDEARQCVARIAHHLEEARALLLELYEREGWRALGYDSWRACVTAEFAESQATLYRQLTAARIERTISHNEKNGAPLPVLHALELAPLEPPEQHAIAAANDVSRLTLGQLRAAIRDRQAAQRATRLDNRPVAVPPPMQRTVGDNDDDTCR